MIVTYVIAVVVILGLCAVGLSIGLILKGKPLQSCGRVVTASGEQIACPSCGSKTGDCEKDKK